MAPLKMILTWDIRPDREQTYTEFINERFAPGLAEIGLQPVDVFYTAYGKVPQIMAVLDVPSEEHLQQALRSPTWQELKKTLLELTEHYQERVFRGSKGDYFA